MVLSYGTSTLTVDNIYKSKFPISIMIFIYYQQIISLVPRKMCTVKKFKMAMYLFTERNLTRVNGAPLFDFDPFKAQLV